mgnify:CR=1 FL=1
MAKQLNITEQEELFSTECKLINLKYEYQGYTGTEKWAVVSELSEKELFEKEELKIRYYEALAGQDEYFDDCFKDGLHIDLCHGKFTLLSLIHISEPTRP